jgi:hypothetical protein
VRRRLEGISAAAGVALANLDIQVITAPTVRLDLSFACSKRRGTARPSVAPTAPCRPAATSKQKRGAILSSHWHPHLMTPTLPQN